MHCLILASQMLTLILMQITFYVLNNAVRLVLSSNFIFILVFVWCTPRTMAGDPGRDKMHRFPRTSRQMLSVTCQFGSSAVAIHHIYSALSKRRNINHSRRTQNMRTIRRYLGLLPATPAVRLRVRVFHTYM